MEQAATLYYVVRNCLLMRDGSANLTLDPVDYWNPNTDELVPPDHPDAELDEPGGKTTELRFATDPGLRPDDLITVTVETTSTG